VLRSTIEKYVMRSRAEKEASKLVDKRPSQVLSSERKTYQSGKNIVIPGPQNLTKLRENNGEEMNSSKITIHPKLEHFRSK
jgi:hypothetical protein